MLCVRRASHPSVRHHGFTLVELIITLAVLAILVAIGLPSFERALGDTRMRGQVSDFASAVRTARLLAVQRARPTAMAPLGNDWSSGWQVFADGNRNGKADAGETTVLKVASDQIASGFKFGGDDRPFTFEPNGARGATSAASVTVCASHADTASQTISVSVTGNTEIAKSGGSCS